MAFQILSGQDGLVRNRAGWAVTDINRAGLLAALVPRTCRANDASLAFLKMHTGDTASRDLLSIHDSHRFFHPEATEGTSGPLRLDAISIMRMPEETIDGAIQTIHGDIHQRLLDCFIAE